MGWCLNGYRLKTTEHLPSGLVETFGFLIGTFGYKETNSLRKKYLEEMRMKVLAMEMETENQFVL